MFEYDYRTVYFTTKKNLYIIIRECYEKFVNSCFLSIVQFLSTGSPYMGYRLMIVGLEIFRTNSRPNN